MEILVLTSASFFAGLIDSIVGGGGLILVPALFAMYPSTAAATLFGTNKSASVWGTSFAAYQYSKRVAINWPVLLPAAGSAFIGSFFGAWSVTQIDSHLLRQALPIVLLAVLIYTLANKDFGKHHIPFKTHTGELAVASAIGAIIGWYDGFFGPGTGSFFIFLLIRYLGYDFLNASAFAKFLNVATNMAALILFSMKGHIWWQIGMTMALANIAGSWVGARLALKYGTGFVRQVFVLVVSLLILKTGFDAFGVPHPVLGH